MKYDSLGDDVEFINVEAQRIKELDQYYRGRDEMDWFFDDDRVVMVKFGGFSCDPDVMWEDCEKCPAKNDCSLYQKAKDGEQE